MKYLGIDYGLKRTGVAISDDAGSFAFPKEIVPTDIALEYILATVTTEKISGIVIGESLASNGIPNKVDEEVKSFTEKIKNKTKIPVFFEREGYSSVEAHRYQTKKGSRDDSAAAVILQRFLDKQNVTQ
jgi:putative Holliday junction resolvase